VIPCTVTLRTVKLVRKVSCYTYAMEFLTLDKRLEDKLAKAPKRERGLYVFLEQHPDYKGHLLLDSFDSFFVRDFFDIIGEKRACSLLRLPKLVDRAEEHGYKLVWLEKPDDYLSRLEALTVPYPYKLNLDLKPFQVQGFNWLKNQHAEILDWSTGTGKSVYACAKAKYLLEEKLVDHVIIVSKKHNRVNWQRQLIAVADIESPIIGMHFYNGEWKEKRLSKRKGERLDPNVKYRREQYKSQVFVTNYEKFRDDKENLMKALTGKRVYFVWDEMPTKLKNQGTKLYRATRTIVNKTKKPYHSCLSATAVENIPEDVYWCVKLMDKTILHKYVTAFREDYVKQWDWFAKGKVKTWDTAKLQDLGLRLAHMTHQASKYRDPEIRAQFPEEHWETVYIEMSSHDRKLYQAIEKEVISDFWDGGKPEDIFSKIQPLQLVCNNPSMLGDGKIARMIRAKHGEISNANSAKLETLKDLLLTLDGKVVLFSAYAENGSWWLTEALEEWGVNAILYDGNATKMQRALDSFKSDPDIKVFVSSDKGSDSINLEEAVNVINYDLPWKFSTLLQRVNRISRITSKGIGVDHVFFYNLVMANTIEERKELIISRKKAYGEAVFGNDIADHAEELSALTTDDLWFILTGKQP
jgi:SNF2 family DNA or RNA helicase